MRTKPTRLAIDLHEFFYDLFAAVRTGSPSLLLVHGDGREVGGLAPR